MYEGYGNFYIGGYIDKLFNSEYTIKEINKITSKYPIDLKDSKGKSISWNDFYDSTGKEELWLNKIIRDRKLRVDQNQKLKEQPLLFMYTLNGERNVVRIHVYRGNEKLLYKIQ